MQRWERRRLAVMPAAGHDKSAPKSGQGSCVQVICHISIDALCCWMSPLSCRGERCGLQYEDVYMGMVTNHEPGLRARPDYQVIGECMVDEAPMILEGN
mmetsp:Transcript_12496/g.28586  ORF Transcript_12496/g.28586 Transcript_12496/m.28586 type:complete len:99 (-) Transcript_12496:46-342(-)